MCVHCDVLFSLKLVYMVYSDWYIKKEQGKNGNTLPPRAKGASPPLHMERVPDAPMVRPGVRCRTLVHKKKEQGMMQIPCSISKTWLKGGKIFNLMLFVRKLCY